MYLLNIQSSPRRARSASIAVADAFVEAYRQVFPEVIVDILNVWEENLPEFDQEGIGAKYKGTNKQPMDETEQKVWDRIQALVARFKRADRIVIGVPMWNFAYPYKLKQLIDLVAQRNLLFTYDGRSYGPLLETPRALLILTRGGAFAEDLPTPPSRFDHQKSYLEFWLPPLEFGRSRLWWLSARRGPARKKGNIASSLERKRQGNWPHISEPSGSTQ